MISGDYVFLAFVSIFSLCICMTIDVGFAFTFSDVTLL